MREGFLMMILTKGIESMKQIHIWTRLQNNTESVRGAR